MKSRSKIKSEARIEAFSLLRKAWKRYVEYGGTVESLAGELTRTNDYVRRVLEGRTPTLSFDTLLFFLNGMGFFLTFDIESMES